MTTANDQDGRAQAESQAVAWLLRLDAPDAADADWLALAAWLEAAPANREAFDRAERLSFEVAALAPDLIRGLDAAKAEPAPVSAPIRSTLRRPAGRRASLPQWAWAAAGLAAAACFALVMFPVLAPPAPAQDYQTAKGQTRTVALADGTHIALNSDTRISVRLEAHTRHVEMLRGEAAFDVAHDASRPFLIAAADRRIRVLGTEFNVLHSQGLVRVTVRRGIVGVSPASAAEDTRGVLLKVGDQFEHRTGEQVSAVHKVDPEVAFAWRRGDLIYRDQPLSEVVGDLNRYFATPVRVAGPAGDLKFSGVLVVDSEDAVVARLRAFLPISVDRASDGLTLRLRDR
jgi:transmembrane sensor